MLCRMSFRLSVLALLGAAAIALPLRATAQDAAGAAASPCAAPLIAGFSHELRDGRHVTSVEIGVPAPLSEVAAVLADPASLPGWLFRGPGGAPTLHDVSWDRATGAFRVLVGAGGEGLPLQGTMRVESTPAGTSMRGSGSHGDVRSWSFEVSARPDAACADRSLVALRMELAFSMKARLFGGQAKSLPLLLALAARDDIASRFVLTPERLRGLGMPTVVANESGRPALSLEGKPVAEVLSCRPHGIGVGAARAAAFGQVLQSMESGKVDIGDLLDAMTAAIDGRHPVLSWRLEIAGRDAGAVLLPAPASVHAGATVQPEKKGFSLAVAAGASKE